ncbi:hypothetical protein OAR27_01710 [Alphaproteobacteria bacterium]|nr:hypothetical protein [Alphaproteobacteria bacterium]
MAGKKLKAAYESFDREAVFALEDAVGMVKKNATAKFDETIEICMNLGFLISPNDHDRMVSGEAIEILILSKLCELCGCPKLCIKSFIMISPLLVF